MAERSVSERALRVELGELRAQVAERDRTIVLLADENAALRAPDAALAVRLVALAERVEELERRLGQNPRSSHKPPSSEGYEKPAPQSRRERTDRSSGGQPGHDGSKAVHDQMVAAWDEAVRWTSQRSSSFLTREEAQAAARARAAEVLTWCADPNNPLPDLDRRVLEHACRVAAHHGTNRVPLPRRSTAERVGIGETNSRTR